MPLWSQFEEESNHLERCLFREHGKPLPHPSRQEDFPQRPDIDTRNCGFVSQTFRHFDHILTAANDGAAIAIEDESGGANELAAMVKTKGEHLRTILKWVLKQEFWGLNMHPAGNNRNVLNVFVEEGTCLFCNGQYGDDVQAMACVYLHINLNPQ